MANKKKTTSTSKKTAPKKDNLNAKKQTPKKDIKPQKTVEVKNDTSSIKVETTETGVTINATTNSINPGNVKVENAKASEKKPLTPVKNKRPSRLNYIWIIPLLLIFVTVIGLPTGFYFATIFDPKTKEVPTNTQQDMSNLVNCMMAKSIDQSNTKGTEGYGKMLIDINERSLDKLAMTARNKLVEKSDILKEFIPKMYFTVEENHYTLYAEVNINDTIITRISVKTTLEEKQGEDPNNPSLFFHIDSINVGRLSLPDMISQVLTNFLNQESLKEMFKNVGFNFEIDLSKKTIEYRRGDFINDLENIIKKNLGESNVFGSIICHILNYMYFDPYGEISFGVDLTKMHQSDTKKSKHSLDIIPYDDLNSFKQKVTTLFDNNVISTSDEARNVFMFLEHGYYDENEQFNTFYQNVKDIDLSSIGINDKRNYIIPEGSDELHRNVIHSLKDSIVETVPSITEIQNFASSTEPGTLPLCRIGENTMYNFAKSLSLLGNATYLVGINEDGKYVSNHLTISNIDFTINPNDNSMYMFVDLSVNGYIVRAILTCVPTIEKENMTVSFKIKEINIGNENLKAVYVTKLIDFLVHGNGIIESEDESFKINIEKEAIDINLKPALDDETYTAINYLLYNEDLPYKFDLKTVNVTAVDENYIMFALTKELK